MCSVLAVASRVFLGSIALFLISGPVRAGTFDVKGVEVVKGESELALGAAWQHGLPVNSDFLPQSYEAAYGYGLLSWFKAGAKIGFEQADGERLDASYAGVEAQAVLIDPARGGFGLAWYTGMDFSLRPDGGKVMAFGPLVSFDLAKDLSVTLNPLFQKAWSPTTPGIDFNYAWQVKGTVNDTVAVGLEGYGVVPDIADAPSMAFQEHRLGPVIYLSLERGGGNVGSMKLRTANNGKLELQAGVLLGLTDATADTTTYAKLAITW